jgi:hypothetical protein
VARRGGEQLAHCIELAQVGVHDGGVGSQSSASSATLSRRSARRLVLDNDVVEEAPLPLIRAVVVTNECV